MGVVCFFLLPISFLYGIFFYLRNRIVLYLHSAPGQHSNRVAKVQDCVRKWKKEGNGRKMCAARPSFLSMTLRYGAYKDTHWKIPINMHDILEINVKDETIKAEPLVTMGQISASLIPKGWTLAIVPELDDFTVGGLIMGVGVESSSHIFGLFQHICVSFDIITSDGNLVHCSETEHEDLFRAIPWSHGTIGFLVAAELKIIPSKPFVKLNYFPCNSRKFFVEKFADESNDRKNDFVEGILLTESSGVVMTGTYSDAPKSTAVINRLGQFWKPWFYKHLEAIQASGSCTEYIPLRDYYHRHTSGIFWEMEQIVPFGNHPIFRYTCGWMMPPKVSLLKLTQGKTIKRLYEERHVIQDILMPVEKLAETFDIFDEEFKVYPLWVCPFNLPNNPGLVHPKEDKAVMYVDVGAYGVPKVANFDSKKALKKVESFAIKKDGFQMLYADTTMTREEFNEMFDQKLYLKVRERYGCIDAFPDVYDKVGKHAWK